MKRRTGTACLIVALTLGLAACAVTDRVGSTTQRSYDPSMLNDIAKRGGMPLVVLGDPFPGAADRFAEVAAERFTNSRFGPKFVVYPQGDAPKGVQTDGNPWKTVLIVNADAPVTSAAACTAAVSGSAVGEGQADFTAALCKGDKAVTSLRGWGSGITGPGSQRLRQLLGNLAVNLYPLRDDDQDRGDVDFPI